jgi:hypothetical protein
MNNHPTFEETYLRYEFAELVWFGIALGGCLLRMLRPDKAAWSSTPALDQASPTQAMMVVHPKA